MPAPRAPSLDAALARLGYPSFRPGQREAIETLLERGRLLLVAPTGGGKSLIYQLPATRAARHDARHLAARRAHDRSGAGARGARRGGDASSRRRSTRARCAAAWRRWRRGASTSSTPRRSAWPSTASAGSCATSSARWSRSTRRIASASGATTSGRSTSASARCSPSCGAARVLACTATATPIVRDEILARLGLPADTPQIVRGFARPNLALRARGGDGRARAGARSSTPPSPRRSAAADRARGTAIVYAPTREQAEEETERLAGARLACARVSRRPRRTDARARAGRLRRRPGPDRRRDQRVRHGHRPRPTSAP